MLFRKQNWFWIIPALILWGLFYLFYSYSGIESSSLLRSFLFSFSIFATLIFIHRKLVPKLSTFSLTTQVLLKSLLYIVSILAVGSIIFIVFAFYSLSKELVISEIIMNFAEIIRLLIISPVLNTPSTDIIPQKVEKMFYMIVFSFTLVGLASALFSFIQTRWSNERSKAQINEAQIKMLQAQIQPHFLFNTLNTIV